MYVHNELDLASDEILVAAIFADLTLIGTTGCAPMHADHPE